MLNAATRLRVVSTPVDRALELSATWDEKLRADLPECEIFDVHTHIGDDIDGMRGRPDELLSIMDAYGIAQSKPRVRRLVGAVSPSSRAGVMRTPGTPRRESSGTPER